MFRTALLFAALPLTLTGCANIVAGPGGTALQEERARNAELAEQGTGLRCRTIRQTGSRVNSRVCLTDEEWELREQEAQEAHDRLGEPGERPPSSDQGFGG
ncbi:MAG: hypothetical protein DHS20C06_05110 [Hyphobacterium sp.]|nr:MAG: hypothetical protein DHS20C06_05110 [Hyphobacterium sp.]